MKIFPNLQYCVKYFVGTLNPDDPCLPVYDKYVNKSRPVDKYKKDVSNEIMDFLNKCEPE